LVALVAALPLVLLYFPSNQVTAAASFAPCHQENPDSDTPPVPNHDCCLIGHNHALAALWQVLPALQFVAVEQIAETSPILLLQARPETALTSFGPPSGYPPLRI
jgi:hypothetical protein